MYIGTSIKSDFLSSSSLHKLESGSESSYPRERKRIGVRTTFTTVLRSPVISDPRFRGVLHFGWWLVLVLYSKIT